MTRLDLIADEASLLRAYNLSTLTPTQWEDVDHDLDEDSGVALPGALTSSSLANAERDPLGLGSIVDLRDMDLQSKAAVLISSKSFDPKAFLSAVHPNATYQDLSSGISNLRTVLDSHSEAIRTLVEGNFDRFVAVKASTDALYAEMSEGLLAPDTEFASKTVRHHLKLGAQKANQVFLPVLENASKASKLRTTLGIFERSKFFFNLPGVLAESIEAGRYDVALRDYKKGKFLLDSRPGQLLPLPSSSGSSAKDVEAQQRRVLDKVWANVEKAMGEMRNVLVGMLKDEGRSVEEQERTIEILLELNSADDPAWTYFDAQHKFIMDQMNTGYRAAIANIKAIHQRTTPNISGPESLTDVLTTQLQSCLAAMDGKMGGETVIARSGSYEIWIAILEMVKNVLETMLTNLPNFWRVAKSFLEGKFRRPTPGSGTRRSPTQVRTMALDIIKLLISLQSEFFMLSDMAVMLTSRHAVTLPPLLPLYSNTFTTGHYLVKILAELQDGINDINGMDISGEVGNELKGLLESTKWRFEDILITAWLRDANIFYNLEAWVSSQSEPSTTLYLSQFELFQQHATTSAFKLAGGIDLSPSLTKPMKQHTIAPAYTSKISKAFLDALYAFLDGLVQLASDQSPAARRVATGENKTPGFVPNSTAGVWSNRLELPDLSAGDTRLLLVLSNLATLMKTLIPRMTKQLETAFGISIDDDRSKLANATRELDERLFESYIRPKIDGLLEIVRSGILETNIDWFDMPQPTEIRPYMFETLIYLVGVHAQVSAAAESMLDRTLCSLVDALAEDSLRSFRSINRFGMGGMLRATLEIEFMHQTLSRYVTPTAAKTLSEVYNKISQAYTRRPGDENLQSNLEGVKKTLADTRRATGIEFLCFRPTKTTKERSGSRSNTRTRGGDR